MKLFDSSAPAARPLREVRLAAINFIADAVNRTLDLKEIADNALHAILSVTKLDAGAMYVWQASDEVLRLFAWRGISEAFARQAMTLRKGDDSTVDAVLEGETKIIGDFTLAPRAFGVDDVRAGFRSAIMCPIRAQGFVVGLLALGTYKTREFETDDISLIEVISNQIGNAMVHAQLEADLRASEEQYRGMVENSDDAIYIAGPDGRPRFANSAFPRIFGFQMEELAAIDPFDRIHPDDLPVVRDALAKLVRGESVHSLEYRFCRKDGQWIDLQCNASVFSRDEDQVEEFQFVVREVTQMRQRQQQLIRRNRQLAALTTLAAVANSSLNIEEIARNTLEVALESTGIESGGIHLVDLDRTQLRLYVQIGLPQELVEQLRVVPWGVGVTGAVAASGHAKIYSDLASEAPMARPSAHKHGFKSLIVVPVKAKGEVLGTLGLMGKREVQFAPEVVEMVNAMGNQFGIAIANARLYEMQLRENEKLNALVEISGGGSQRLELEPLLQRILIKSATLLKADAAYIVRYEGDQAEVVAATAGFERLIGTRYAGSTGLSGQVQALRQGKIFTRDEVAQHVDDPILRGANVRSALVVPLVSRNELIGALALTRESDAASDFSAADLDLMEAFASRAAVAIDNVQLLKDLRHKNELLELLIEEAHHRIKNNLQMISGLLQLEAEIAGGGSSSERLRQAIARIQAIAQVHHLLSKEMPEKVDTHALITTIVDTLVSSAPTVGAAPQVTLELEHLWLNADQAVALALIVNELVANSLLHGRPTDGQALHVKVQCQQQGNQVFLVAQDNGGGFKDGKDWRSFTGQGMNITNQLVQVNLRGELQIGTRNGGVRAELRFEIAGRPSERTHKLAEITAGSET
ncbi:MAG: GAF domain-containing protein [Verrucomicrobiia bacterium]